MNPDLGRRGLQRCWHADRLQLLDSRPVALGYELFVECFNESKVRNDPGDWRDQELRSVAFAAIEECVECDIRYHDVEDGLDAVLQ